MATVNPWRRFIGLLPGGARTVGEVIDVDEAPAPAASACETTS